MQNEKLKALVEPFPEQQVRWRAGRPNAEGSRAQALPYIDPRAIQQRLDDVVSPGGWKTRYTEVIADGKLVLVRCALGIKVDGEWVEKEDAAPVSYKVGNPDFEVKGAHSEAFKRAAVLWGIGRYLYDYKGTYVELDANGRLAVTPVLPPAFLPESERKAAANRPAPAKAVEQTAPQAAEPKKEETVKETAPVEPAPKSQPEPQAKAEPQEAAEATPHAEQAKPAQERSLAAEVLLGPDERADRAAELVDAAMSRKPVARTEKPAPAPAAVNAAPTPKATATGDEEEPALPWEIPSDLPDSDAESAKYLLSKLVRGVNPKLVENYARGPRGKLSPQGLEYVLARIEEFKATQTATA